MSEVEIGVIIVVVTVAFSVLLTVMYLDTLPMRTYRFFNHMKKAEAEKAAENNKSEYVFTELEIWRLWVAYSKGSLLEGMRSPRQNEKLNAEADMSEQERLEFEIWKSSLRQSTPSDSARGADRAQPPQADTQSHDSGKGDGSGVWY